MRSADHERPKKQRHTAKRIFERLRDEHGFTGKVTIVKDYVSGCRQRSQGDVCAAPASSGHAQVDFGEAIGVIGGVERKIHFLAMDLPHSDAIFVVGYPAETTEAFCDGHVRAFEFFDGVPKSIAMSGFNKRKKQIDSLSGVTAWTLHDIRRTVASGLARLKTAPHVVKRILNHTTGTLGGVAGVYNRFGYLDEMREALGTWAKHVEKVTQ